MQLTLPSTAALPLDAPLPHARALIVLPDGVDAPNDDVLTKVVRSTLADERAQVLVLRPKQARAAERLVSIGPFRVDARSAGPLRTTLAVMFITNALLALAVLVQAWRHRPNAPKVDRRGRSGT